MHAFFSPGTVGIVVATQDNLCQDQRLGQNCIPAEDRLMLDENMTNLEEELIGERVRKENYFYWLAGASLSGLILFCVGGSLCVWFATRVVFKLQHQKSTNKGYPLSQTVLYLFTYCRQLYNFDSL